MVTWSLATGFLPSQHRFDGWSTATYWSTAVVAALLLFVSVVIHELAHPLVAKARGFPVAGITLFLLGGVSELRAEARHAKHEFIIAAVGPAASLALAGLLWLVDLAVPLLEVIGANHPMFLVVGICHHPAKFAGFGRVRKCEIEPRREHLDDPEALRRDRRVACHHDPGAFILVS